MPSPSTHDASRPAIAVLGTGRMGAPIARNLLAAGFEVSVWNRTAERAAPLAADGARQSSSPAEAAEGADLTLTMLADGDAVNDAMTGPEGALASLRPGSAWIQMATIGDEWTARLAALATENKLEFVDAPVSGSDGPAREGQLIVLASGPEGTRARVQPIFDAIGRKTLWLGPAGNGTRLKLAFKDVGLALDAARERDLELPITEAISRRWQQAIADGHADEDVSVVIAVAGSSATV